ncbi:hypothetical protein JAAARDRAFT_126811 [Jaapia argillacea MUCL 33604]|uniref:Uncharacterized protein n=1 Tax=Jaapia argillacea MUCL 33604 TaxID=933084 RepID=A0A067QA75_9AGAM|nr:hypothetical protein JAAARDRAFT_126811 [Jaapia argillacea MUCL 33604]
MGGPNLEVFKFGLYVFFPVVTLLYYGDPEWYNKHVIPYKDHIFAREDKIVSKLPTEQSSVRDELARIKAEKLARRMERDKAEETPGSDRMV